MHIRAGLVASRPANFTCPGVIVIESLLSFASWQYRPICTAWYCHAAAPTASKFWAAYSWARLAQHKISPLRSGYLWRCRASRQVPAMRNNGCYWDLPISQSVVLCNISLCRPTQTLSYLQPVRSDIISSCSLELPGSRCRSTQRWSYYVPS